MKLSVTITNETPMTTPVVLRGEYLKSFAVAERSGFQQVELHLTDPKEIDLVSFKKGLSDHNLGVSALGTGPNYGMLGISLTDNKAENRTFALQRVKDCIDFAKEVSAVVILGTIVGKVSDSPSREEYLARLVPSVAALVEYAEEQQTTLVLEAINRYESDFVNNAEQVLQFIAPFNSRRLKVHLDTFHMNIEEEDMCSAIRRCKDTLGHIHFADNRRLAPGIGTISFPQVVQTLRDIDYSGAASVECLPIPSPEEACSAAGAYLRPLISEPVTQAAQ